MYLYADFLDISAALRLKFIWKSRFCNESNFDEESVFLSKVFFLLSKSYISQWCFCVMVCTALVMHLELFLSRDLKSDVQQLIKPKVS